jgi:CBS domain-containing protein
LSPLLLYIVLLILFLALSVFFSAAETAYMAVNRIRLKYQADAGDEKAGAIKKILDNPDRLLGVISDGDLRRLLQLRGKDALDLTAQDCMTRAPKTIGPQEFAATALARMEEMKITSLVVVDGESRSASLSRSHW